MGHVLLLHKAMVLISISLAKGKYEGLSRIRYLHAVVASVSLPLNSTFRVIWSKNVIRLRKYHEAEAEAEAKKCGKGQA